MNDARFFHPVCLWLLGFVFLCALPASAQQKLPADAKETKENVRIRKLEGIGRKAERETPLYTVSGFSPSSVRPRKWHEIMVEFDTDAEWMDEAVFEFFAMAESTDGGKKVYSFYRTTARFADVKRGSHKAAAYLLPTALERHGSVVAIAVEVTSQGKSLASESEVANGAPAQFSKSAKWWRDSAIVDAAVVSKRDGYLLERSKTPFGLLNVDEYEFSR
jgi:hypothetical protein